MPEFSDAIISAVIHSQRIFVWENNWLHRECVFIGIGNGKHEQCTLFFNGLKAALEVFS